MQLCSMFINNCNITLHVSDAFCVHPQEHLTLNLLTTTIFAPPSSVSKWQMGFNL